MSDTDEIEVLETRGLRPSPQDQVTIGDGNTTQETRETTEISIEELELSPIDRARAAVSTVFRDETTQLTQQFLALAQERVKLLNMCYANVFKLNTELFTNLDTDGNTRLTTKEKIYATGMYLKALSALAITLNDNKDIVTQVNTQVNMINNDSTGLSKLPKASREKVRNVVNEVLNQILQGQTEVDILNKDIKTGAGKLDEE